MTRILLFGHAGLLGTELRKLNPSILISEVRLGQPFNSLPAVDVVINAAAIKDNRAIEQNPEKALLTNVIGSAQLAIQCAKNNSRYVYISTDYIYAGDRGNYKETDEILPFNLYAWTKLGGECSARAVKNHVIIRTSFGGSFEYDQAFTDKWSSKDYVDVIAPMILQAAVSPITGVLNIGTERKTLYEHAVKFKEVRGVRIADSSHLTPYDTSLNLQKWMDYHREKAVAKPHTKCRVCGSQRLTKYLDLGLMPLANNLEFTSLRARAQERFPLQVMLCEDCGLSQLSVVIDPEKMFSYYTYRSSVNAPYVSHSRRMAEALRRRFSLGAHSLVIDIAGNDGALLKEFRDVTGCEVINFEPATNLAAIAEAQGIKTIADFWNLSSAIEFSKAGQQADIITATNVFAHVEDIRGFLTGVHMNLKPEGVLVLEFPYLIDFIENNEYDTVYFEHLSYMSIAPINKLCGMTDMKIIDIEKHPIHGGTVRVMLAKSSSLHMVNPIVLDFVRTEYIKGFSGLPIYEKWAQKVKKSIGDFGKEILNLKLQGKRIAGYAASAKGNTLLNAAGLNTDMIDYIVDSTPEKVGKYSPGTGIPIKHPSELKKHPPDYVIILSWNFAEVLIPKVKEMCDAKLIIPIPEFKVL